MRSSIIAALVLASVTGTTYADSQKPTVPENVVATPISESAVRITWGQSYDDQGINGYNIYRNDRYYATVRGATSFIDEQVSPGTSYEYAVVAFDDARNYTVLSDSDDAVPGGGSSATGAAPLPRTPTGDRPAAPNGLKADSQGNGVIKLSWNAAADAASYNVYRDGSYRTTVQGTSWTDSGLSGGREYRYQVVTISADSRYSTRFSNYSGSVVGTTGSGSNESSRAEPEPVATAAAPAPSSSGPSSSAVPDGYRLVFSEDFGGSNLDSSKWNSSYRWGANWTINDEQQYYVDKIANPDFGVSPFEFDGNRMSIVANKTPDSLKSSANNKSYTSGVLTTYKKFEMLYGYVEMRAKLPKGQGLWPALWLLNVSDYGSTPEIDIMEFLGNEPDTIYNVYHSKYVSTPSFEAKGPDYTSDFHTFGMKWTEGQIIWYVDGKEVNRYESGYVANESMYLIVNLALGGSWGGNVDGSTPFPARYQIDYVRAYQR